MSLPPANDVFSKGFGAGIKIWLYFLLAFYVLRYPVPLSIMFGAIAGVSAGFIVGCWNGKPAAVLEEVEEDGLQEVAQTRQRKRRNYARMRNSRNKPEVKWDWNTVKDSMAFWRRS